MLAESGETEEDKQALGVLLAKYPLTSLNLKSYSHTETIPDSWLAIDWNSTSSLQLFAMSTAYFSTQDLRLISKFSSTLETVSLELSALNVDSGYKLTCSFDHLSHLNLELPANLASSLLLQFLNARLLSLHITAGESDGTGTDHVNSDLFITTLKSFPTLNCLVICERFTSPENCSSLIQFCEDKGIHLELIEWKDQYVGQQHESDGWEFETAHQSLYYAPAISKALKYGARKLSNLKKAEDLEGMKEMLENCKWLRASAAEMMD